jgi:hypothetical protein
VDDGQATRLLNQLVQAKMDVLEWVARVKRSARAWLLLMTEEYGRWTFPRE